jgi:hypothetical protein
MPDYGDDRGFGLDRVNPFEQTAQAGSMPGYRDRPSDREIDKRGAAYNEIIAGDRAETGVPAPFWAQKNIPSYPPEYGIGSATLNDFNYSPQNTGFWNNLGRTIKNIPSHIKSGAKATWDEFFGGVDAAEINPQRVLSSDWAKQQIDWEDLEGGMMSPIGYDKAYQNLKNRGDISSWGDLYKLLQSGGGAGLSGHVLEKGLGDFSSEMSETGMFPERSIIPGAQVNPTVESWKGRDYFDVDEGDLEKGEYEKLKDAGWLY